MESNFFVLQVTTAILIEGGSAVQRVYDEKFSNQDQLNIGEAVVTLSGNLLSDILIHVTGNILLQHIFEVHFQWILSGLLSKLKITSSYLENYYIKFPVRLNSYIYILLSLSLRPTEKSRKFVLCEVAISNMRAPALKNLLKKDGLRKSCKTINEWSARKRVICFCEEGSFLLNFFNYWLCNL